MITTTQGNSFLDLMSLAIPTRARARLIDSSIWQRLKCHAHLTQVGMEVLLLAFPEHGTSVLWVVMRYAVRAIRMSTFRSSKTLTLLKGCRFSCEQKSSTSSIIPTSQLRCCRVLLPT